MNCGWRDSNSHDLSHWYLKPARIPISPHPLTKRELIKISVIIENKSLKDPLRFIHFHLHLHIHYIQNLSICLVTLI